MANRIRITLKYPFFPGFRKPGLLRCCQQMRRFGYTGGFTGLAGLLFRQKKIGRGYCLFRVTR